MKNVIGRVKAANTPENLDIRSRALFDLLNKSGVSTLSLALKVKPTTINNFIRRGFMPLKMADKYGQAGYESFTKLLDDTGVSRDQLAAGAPYACFSDYQMTDSTTERDRMKEPDLKAIKKETARLFETFGNIATTAKLFQVPVTTATNWKNSGFVGAKNVLAIKHMPQLKGLLEEYGFTAESLRPDLHWS